MPASAALGMTGDRGGPIKSAHPCDILALPTALQHITQMIAVIQLMDEIRSVRTWEAGCGGGTLISDLPVPTLLSRESKWISDGET